MTDNTELQRLIRLSRLGRQIAARLPADIDFEQAVQICGSMGDLPAGGLRPTRTPTSSKAVLRAELEAAMANYRGQITLCPKAAPPEPHDALDLVEDDTVE